MFKIFFYYYLYIKKKSSCRHCVGVGVAQKVQKSGIINSSNKPSYCSHLEYQPLNNYPRLNKLMNINF